MNDDIAKQYAAAQYEMFRMTKICEKAKLSIFDRAPELKIQHIQNCRLLPNRESILVEIGKQLESPKIVEVGVFKGDYSTRLLELLKPQSLVLIDIGFDTLSQENRAALTADSRVSMKEGDSSRMLSELEDGEYDVIYIDADHSYRAVIKDIHVAKQKIKSDGWLVFNDYTAWSPRACCSNGVARAVNEMCLDDGWEMLYLCLQGLGYNDVATKRIRT